MKMKTKMDEKWRLMTSVFQITFFIILAVNAYLVVISLLQAQYIATLIALFLVAFCVLLEKEFKLAKSRNDITEINVIVRCMMGLLGKLY